MKIIHIQPINANHNNFLYHHPLIHLLMMINMNKIKNIIWKICIIWKMNGFRVVPNSTQKILQTGNNQQM
jgi:hypothetical protein